MKNVVAYIRVSTEGQVDKYGLDAQRKDIMEYCRDHDMYISKWYEEKGVSGVKDARPEFDKILYGEITNPPYEAVVVAKNDRVARDINVYYYFKMLLKKKEIELISVAEDFGEFGIMAHFLEAFTLCVAEMERKNITQRTLSGRMQKAGKGGYAGGRPPYGYYVSDGELKIDPAEAECVRLVFRLRDEGKLLREIVDMVNSEGYRTQKGLAFKIGNVQNILKRERVYKGQLHYGGEYEGVHERIL